MRDTTEWTTTIYGGWRALLLEDGSVIDTIDVSFGVQHVPEGIVFMPIRTYIDEHKLCDPSGICADFTNYVFYDGRTRTVLHERVRELSDQLSSPAVIDSHLYFWAVGRNPDGGYTISAARHNFLTGVTDTSFLYHDPLGTDNPGHLQPPRSEGELIRFGTFRRVLWLTPSLQIVKDSLYES